MPISESIGIETEIFFWAFTIALLFAAFLGPKVGKAIDRLGGRKVLPYGNLIFIAGLTTLAFVNSVGVLFVAWALIGIGAAMGNYDAAFATVVNFFGDKSNKVIAGITVFVGLSSTISWPINAWVTENFGWQQAVMVWAFAHLLIALPLNMTIPRFSPESTPLEKASQLDSKPSRIRFDLLIVVFAIMFALESFMVASVNTTLPFLLSELGASAAIALTAAALLGPSQVLARILLVVLERVMSPISVASISMMAHPVGAILLLIFGVDALIPFVMLHGISVGLDPFIRGTLPLLFFGSEQFGQRQGYIMMFSKIVGAFSPLLLTVIVLVDAKLGIISTMTTGLIASAMLLWLSAIRIRRQRLA